MAEYIDGVDNEKYYVKSVEVGEDGSEVVTVAPRVGRGRFLFIGLMLLPFMIIVPAFLMIPFVLVGGGNPGIAVALIVTVISEIIVMNIAYRSVDATGSVREFFYLKNFSWANIRWGVSFGLLMFVGLQILAILFSQLGEQVESSQTSVELASLGGATFAIVYLIMVPVVVPIMEELFFRSTMNRCFSEAFSSKKVSLALAGFFSSVGFGLAHFQGLSTLTDVLIVVWVSIIGLINWILLRRYDSIYGSMALHITYNSITVATTLIAMM